MQLMAHESPQINGDGNNSRDFTYIDNVIQMNHLAGLTTNVKAKAQVFNTAVGERADLNILCELLKKYLGVYDPKIAELKILIASALLFMKFFADARRSVQTNPSTPYWERIPGKLRRNIGGVVVGVAGSAGKDAQCHKELGRRVGFAGKSASLHASANFFAARIRASLREPRMGG